MFLSLQQRIYYSVYVFYEPWLSSVSVSEPGENSTREVGGDGDGKSSASDQV